MSPRASSFASPLRVLPLTHRSTAARLRPGTCGSAVLRRTSCVMGRFLGCPSGHERWEAYPDFNPGIIDEIFHAEKVPFARAKGIFRKRQHCSRCGASLEHVSETPGIVRAQIRTPNHLDFEIEISGPTLTCPQCQLMQIEDWRSGSDEIVDAMVDALEKSGIKRL